MTLPEKVSVALKVLDSHTAGPWQAAVRGLMYQLTSDVYRERLPSAPADGDTIEAVARVVQGLRKDWSENHYDTVNSRLDGISHRLSRLAARIPSGDAPPDETEKLRALLDAEHAHSRSLAVMVKDADARTAKARFKGAEFAANRFGDVVGVMGWNVSSGVHTWGDLLAELRLRLGGGDAPQEPSDAERSIRASLACIIGGFHDRTPEQFRADTLEFIGRMRERVEASRPPGGAEPGLRKAMASVARRLRDCGHTENVAACWAAGLIEDELGASEGAAHPGEPATPDPDAHTQGVTAGVDALLDLIKFHGLSLPAVEHNRADLRADAICNAIEGARLLETQERETAITQALSSREYVSARSRWLAGAAPPQQPLDRNYIGSMAGSMDSDALHAPDDDLRAALQDYADRLTRIAGGDDTQPTSARHSWPVEPVEPSGVPDAPGWWWVLEGPSPWRPLLVFGLGEAFCTRPCGDGAPWPVRSDRFEWGGRCTRGAQPLKDTAFALRRDRDSAAKGLAEERQDHAALRKRVEAMVEKCESAVLCNGGTGEPILDARTRVFERVIRELVAALEVQS